MPELGSLEYVRPERHPLAALVLLAASLLPALQAMYVTAAFSCNHIFGEINPEYAAQAFWIRAPGVAFFALGSAPLLIGLIAFVWVFFPVKELNLYRAWIALAGAWALIVSIAWASQKFHLWQLRDVIVPTMKCFV